MKYSLTDYVISKGTSLLKKIVDMEIICGVEIYYMSDKTSYSESQLYQDNDKINELVLEANKEKIQNTIDINSYSAVANYVNSILNSK